MPRAVMMHGDHRPLTVETYDLAAPKTHELRVRIAASGVCHSDLHAYEGGGAGMRLPIVLGHEASGVVEEIGVGVEGFSPGDHVVFCVFPQCGTCRYCTSGLPTLCVAGQMTRTGTLLDGTTRMSMGGKPVGQMAGMGAWSEVTVVPDISVVKIDKAIPLPQAALLGCGVVTGFGAVTNVAQVKKGGTVAIIGCGGLGLSAVQAARISGAERIIAVDNNPRKLEYAKTFGATDFVDSSTGDQVARVHELTGVGVDAAFDFVGIPLTAEDAVRMTHIGGTAVLTGLADPTFHFERNDLVRGARQIKGNLMGMGVFADEFPKLVRLYLDGDLMLDELVSKRVKLETVQEAFDAMIAGEVARSVIEINT